MGLILDIILSGLAAAKELALSLSQLGTARLNRL